MSFTSPFYLPFLVLFVVLWWVLRSRGIRPLGVLSTASLLFYASWNPAYAVALIGTAAVDYNVCRSLGRTAAPRRRKGLLLVSLVYDLSALVFFKYFNFFTDSFSRWSAAAGWGSFDVPFKIIFAVGISFYTFQSLAAVIDVYRGEVEPAPSFGHYLAFVAFFPTLLAGPITRPATLFPQLDRPPGTLDPALAGRGFFLIGLGFIKKLVLADYIAVNLVNRVFELPGMYSSVEVLGGIYGYAAQIYCDFSGYSDIAIGSALLIGIELKENFNSPYRSVNLAEFWRRWHMSLSTWLRDYLFFALPGKRPGKPWPYLNLVITFALGGLWHGAAWTFMAWGAMHGLGLAVMRFITPRRPRPKPWWRKLLGVALTFHFVAFSWLFFRCGNLADVGAVLGRLGALSTSTANLPLLVVLAVAAGIGAQWLPENWFVRAEQRFVQLPAPMQTVCLIAAAAAVAWVSGSAVAQFIYFSY